MRRILRSLALLVPILFCARPADAKLEPAAWQGAEHQFRELFKVPGEADKKREVIQTVVKDGESRAWNLLSDGLLLTAGHLTKVNETLAKDLTELQKFLAVPLHSDAEWEVIHKLQKQVSDQEAMRGGEDGVLKALIAAFGEAPEEGRKFALAKARGAKDWPIRAAAARIAAVAPDEASSKQTLVESLAKDSDPRVKIAALDALQKAVGTTWQDAAIGRIEDPDWGVQLLAVRLAGEREIGKAIPVLIKALATSSPRVSEAIVVSLRKLTGESSIEAYAEPWAKWWEANREKWGADGRPLQPVVSGPRQSDIDAYGIRLKTSRVLFIIDISGSMKEEKKGDVITLPAPRAPKPDEPPKPPPPPPPESFSGPKIEWAKRELNRALDKLPKETMFDIISFNHAVILWKPKMVQATEANKQEAKAWFKEMKPSGSTYIDGALQLAFSMAGMGAYDKAYPGVGVDTILLLSDGAPTDNTLPVSNDMPPDDILKHVAEWNPQKRIVIHCVGIDNVVQGIEFLKKLAAQNGGTYRDG